MKKILTPVIRYAIDKVKRNKYIQNLFESPFDLGKFQIIDTYSDAYGNTFELLDGLRSKIKPGWEKMLRSGKTDISDEYLSKQRENGIIAVSKIVPIIKTLGKKVEKSTILEIGCHAGAASFTLAEKGAYKVMGTEFAGYKVASINMNNPSASSELMEVNNELKNIREQLGLLFDGRENVQFVDDDICNSSLEANSFDIICSWEVLEHLHDTEKAFTTIYNLLKEDGITIHEYNPFFCLNGGHSLCTLDFLWGHIRLNESDFNTYIDKFRPEESRRALSFYKKGLNRLTLFDLKNQMLKAGLEIISILPFTKEQHIRMMDQEILAQSQMHYPNVTILDLTAPRVYVVAKKTAGNT